MEMVFGFLGNLTNIITLAESNGGIFSFLWETMGSFLRFFYNITGDWGLAIILLTLVLKLILYPSSVKQNKSMQDMQRIQPEIKEIQNKYKDDKQTQQQKMMELYKKYNINPLSSCLPLLIQLPILIALFQTIIRLEDLQGASFLWMASLGEPDLPLAILTGVTMFLQTHLQQKWSGAPANPQTKTMGMVMPVLIVFFGMSLPSGVLVYWFTSNLAMIGQQYLIYRRQEVAKGESS